MAPTTKNLIVVAQVIIAVSSGLGFEQLGTDIVLVNNPLQVCPTLLRSSLCLIQFSHLRLSVEREWENGDEKKR
jgi:hypothetical protein